MRFVALFLVAACSATAATTSATVETIRAPTTAAPDHPPLVGPAGNGLIAYSYAERDLHRRPRDGNDKGDRHRRGVRIPTQVSRRMAPGSRFVRGDPYGDASLVVVQCRRLG